MFDFFQVQFQKAIDIDLTHLQATDHSRKQTDIKLLLGETFLEKGDFDLALEHFTEVYEKTNTKTQKRQAGFLIRKTRFMQSQEIVE